MGVRAREPKVSRPPASPNLELTFSPQRRDCMGLVGGRTVSNKASPFQAQLSEPPFACKGGRQVYSVERRKLRPREGQQRRW